MGFLRATFLKLAFSALLPVFLATAEANARSSEKSGVETHKDLIAKAQNLTLQRDRLQASQVLIRGIHREAKGGAAAKELIRALDDLSSVFYTDKAQSLFATAEAQPESKAREAIEQFQEALRLEENNLTILKSLGRAHLMLGECDKADAAVKSVENINPYSAEGFLLRLQVLDCQQKYDVLSARLASMATLGKEIDLTSIEKYTRGLQVGEALRKKDIKKAKAIIASWETQAPDYPESQFWKWRVSRQAGEADRSAAAKYLRLCQNLTPRRRKSYNLDVELCKGKQAVDTYLKESSLRSSPATGEEPAQ